MSRFYCRDEELRKLINDMRMESLNALSFTADAVLEKLR